MSGRQFVNHQVCRIILSAVGLFPANTTRRTRWCRGQEPGTSSTLGVSEQQNHTMKAWPPLGAPEPRTLDNKCKPMTPEMSKHAGDADSFRPAAASPQPPINPHELATRLQSPAHRPAGEAQSPPSTVQRCCRCKMSNDSAESTAIGRTPTRSRHRSTVRTAG